METGQLIKAIKDWRSARGLTMRQAGALIVVDGRAISGATWHAWEWNRKRPSRWHMPVFCQVTGLSADLFNSPLEPDATAPVAEAA